MTPTVARTLTPSQVPALKSLLLTGEPVTVADVSQWQGLIALYSVYGQSESASTVLVRQLNSSTHEAGSIGSPTTGKCWVVDQADHHRLSAAGIEGELLIESSAMGTCYLGNHEQTAAAFVDPPAWSPQVNGYQSR
jgi:long-subunit acyl-CoA synthetase (AMP-forming)